MEISVGTIVSVGWPSDISPRAGSRCRGSYSHSWGEMTTEITTSVAGTRVGCGPATARKPKRVPATDVVVVVVDVVVTTEETGGDDDGDNGGSEVTPVGWSCYQQLPEP